MSVYIDGLEIPPKGKGAVVILCSSGAVYSGCQKVGTAVPVPQHGRLIDADALDSSETDYLGNHLVYLVDIDNAPTIIPAEPFNNLSKPCKDDEDIPICTKASPASLGIYKKAEEREL